VDVALAALILDKADEIIDKYAIEKAA